MKIFAYVDPSSTALSVIRHAVWASKQLDAPLEIIHVLDHPVPVRGSDFSGYMTLDASVEAVEERIRLDEMQNRVLIEEGRRLLDALVQIAQESGTGRVSQRLFQGTLLEHLQQNVADALLVVLGKRGEGAYQDPQHLGRNIERVVRSAHTPVLIAAADFVDVKQAVIAWDGGKSSGEAIHFLASQPLLHDVNISLLHVIDRPDQLPPAVHDARDHLVTSGMNVVVATRTGAVPDEVLDALHEPSAQLLVLGAYGHSRIRQLMVGSTTTELLMRCETSMLVFH